MNYYLNLIVRVILCFVPVSVFSFFLTPLTIYASYFLLSTYNPTLVERTILINGINFEFVEACIATYAYYLLWILCLLTKDITLKNRFKIIGYGFLLIFAMNILRIGLIMILALDYGFFWFNIVHMFFWKFLSGVYVALVWIMLVNIYKIKSVPIYSDLKTLYKQSIFKRKSTR